MHFEPCSISEVRGGKASKSQITKLLMQIIDSGNACVEVKDFEHKTPQSCANALRVRIKADRIKQLEVVVKNKRVFVINTLRVKEAD